MEEKKLTGYPSIDKPWLKYYSEEAITAPLPECTIYESVWQHNKDHINDIALKYNGCKITYRKLFREVERTAKALRQAGIEKGVCLALCVAGIPEAVYIVLACSRIGAVASFINPMFSTEQMIDRINDMEAETLIILDTMYHFIAEAIDKTTIKYVIVVSATGSLSAPVRAFMRLKKASDINLHAAIRSRGKFVSWKTFLRAGECYTGSIDEPYEKNRPVVMVYSSGTTGASKGIILTNDGINATIHEFVCTGMNFARHQSYLHIVPVWFSTGIVFNLLLSLQIGMITILEPMFSGEKFSSDVKRYRPTHMMIATSNWLHAVTSKQWKGLDMSFVKLPMTGGEAMLPRTEQRINAMLHKHGCKENITKGYGMCELGSAATAASNNAQHDFNACGSVGIPLPHVIVAAFDVRTDDELSYFQRGELRIVSPCKMLAYYKRPDATAAFFHVGKDGNVWGCTGDIGYIDDKGNVFVLGRASDYYIATNGDKVYLFDIENVILQDEAVELCEVVTGGIDGRSPIAHVVLKTNIFINQMELMHRINARCRAKLPEYAVPIAYKFRDSFPIKPSGKRDIDALKVENDGFLTV